MKLNLEMLILLTGHPSFLVCHVVNWNLCILEASWLLRLANDQKLSLFAAVHIASDQDSDSFLGPLTARAFVT